MSTYVILSQLTPGAFTDPKDFKKMAETVSEKIKNECPGVTWKYSFATMGRFESEHIQQIPIFHCSLECILYVYIHHLPQLPALVP